jgi:hypothetical protein
MADFYRDLVSFVREKWLSTAPFRQGGSEVCYNPVNGKRVSVPRTTKSRHTANEVLKQAGLPKAF